MKKTSRLLYLAISICLMLSLVITGCSKTGSTGTAGGTQATGDSAGTDKSLAPYQVTWYTIGNTSEPDEKLIENAVGDYLKDKINTTVDIIAYPIGEYQDKVRTIIQSGEKADLFFTCSWHMDYITTVRDGLAAEITDDMLNNYAPSAKQVLGSTAYLAGAKIDGKLYTLPCNKEVGAQGGVILNKAMVDKYNINIKDIKKYDDLVPILQMIKENEPNSIPIDTSRNNHSSQIINCYGDNVGQAFEFIKMPMSGGDWLLAFDMPEIVDVFRTNKRIYDLGLIREDAVTLLDIMPDLKTGRVFASWQQLKPGKDAEMTSSTGVEWVQVPLTDPVTRSSDPTGSMMAIPATCQDPSRVLMFYDYFYHDRELLTLVNFGIENTHWVKIDANTIDFAPATEGGTKSGWNPPFNTWTVGNQFLNYIFEGEDPNKHENMKAFNATCKPFESVGFIMDTKSCENMIEKLRAVQVDEYTLLAMGVVDDVDATMQVMLDKWNEAGLQDVIAEYNRQYKEWKAQAK